MKNILLIDDEEDVRDSVERILEMAGFDVEAVSSAEEGLARIGEKDFDLVITDIIMPGINGVDAIKCIRRTSPDIRVLAISGGGNFGLDAYKPEAVTTAAYLQAATDAGADAILTKPFQKTELLQSIQRLTAE